MWGVLYTCFLNHLVTCNQHKLAELRFLTHDKGAFKTTVNQVMCYILHHFDSLTCWWWVAANMVKSLITSFWLKPTFNQLKMINLSSAEFGNASWLQTSMWSMFEVRWCRKQELHIWCIGGPWTVIPLLDSPYLLTVVQHPQKLLYTCMLTPTRSMLHYIR